MKSVGAAIIRGMMLFLMGVSAVLAQSQAPARIMIQAGTPEDKALRVAENENDVTKRIQLLDQFLKDFPAMNTVLEVNELYTVSYQQLKDSAKVVEYGEKALAVKADDMVVLPLVINALLDQQKDYGKAYQYAKEYYAAAQKPDATIGGRLLSEPDHTRIQAEAKALRDASRQQVEYHAMQSAYQETDPAKKIADLEGFVKEFPDSTQVCSAYSMMAITYLQRKNLAQSADSAESCLKVDPNNLDMMVLLADLRVEDKTKMKETADLIDKAIGLADELESQPAPAGQSAADWTKRENYLRGTAHGLRGYLAMKQGLYAKSLPDLELAQKLLGDDSATLYRLGFALAKVRRTRDAQIYLSRAARIPGPFQQAARTALAQLQR